MNGKINGKIHAKIFNFSLLSFTLNSKLKHYGEKEEASPFSTINLTFLLPFESRAHA